MELSERQRRILNVIIDDYILHAEPVGSRSISKRDDISFSPATIRNEMADLEEMGLLEQPHTSAGRIPSIKGYRYYVDHLVPPSQMGEWDIRKLRELFAAKSNHWESLMEHSATILSQLTNYTSIMLGPEVFDRTLKHFQLVPIDRRSSVAIVVTDTGHVEHRTLTLPEGVSMHDMIKTVKILNDKLIGTPFYKIKSVLHTEVGAEIERYVQDCDEIISLLEKIIVTDQEQKVFLSGTLNMLSQPEFKDVLKAKNVLELLEETPVLIQLFQTNPEGIQIKIGTEIEHKGINSCSLITATYSFNGQSLGTIGILGPTRMEYGKVIKLLDYLSHDLESLMIQLQ